MSTTAFTESRRLSQNADNYKAWKSYALGYLRANGATNVVNVIADGSKRSRQSQISANERGLAGYLLMQTLCDSVQDEVMALLNSSDMELCPFAIMRELDEKFETTSERQIIVATRQLGRFDFDPKTDIIAQFRKLESWFNLLQTSDPSRVLFVREALASPVFRPLTIHMQPILTTLKYDSCKRLVMEFFAELPKDNKPVKSTPREISDKCKLHPNGHHSNSDCRAQKTSTTTSDETSKTPATSKKAFTVNSVPEPSSSIEASVANTSPTNKTMTWILDSGAPQHYANDASVFTSLLPVACEPPISGLGGVHHEIRAIGTVCLPDVLGPSKPLILKNVRLVPTLPANLLSEIRLCADNADLVQTRSGSNLTLNFGTDGSPLIIQPDPDHHGLLTIKVDLPETCFSVLPLTMQEAHKRLGRAHPDKILRMATLKTHNFKLLDHSLDHCRICLEANIQAQPRDSVATRDAARPGECINADLCGPIAPTTADGKRYLSILVDRYSGHCSVHTLPSKSSDAIIDQLQMFARELGHPISTIRTDNGTEYTSNSFTHFLRSENINHEVTNPDSPSQNGKAERYLALIQAKMRALLKGAPLVSEEYWDYAAEHAAYLLNHLPSKGNPNMNSPATMLGKPPVNVAHLPPFGAECITKIPGTRKRLEDRGTSTVFLGYPKTSAGFYTLAAAGQVFRSSNVVFLTGPSQIKSPPATHAFLTNPKPDDPDWFDPVKEELQAHLANKTFEDVQDIPEGSHILSSRLVYKEKLGPSNELLRRKARLVIRGFTQQEGLDFDICYAPVINQHTLFFLLALATANKMHIHQVDVKTAYLNAPVQHVLHARLPKHPALGHYSNRIVRLRKAIYGLRQAGYEWHSMLSQQLKAHGWEPFMLDTCLFRRDDCYLAVYVDDIIIIGKTLDEVDNIKKTLSTCFEIADNGPINFLLGMRINYDREVSTMLIDQEAAIDRFLQLFPASGSASIPLHPKWQSLALSDSSSAPADQLPQQIGFLLYICRHSRPDIAYAVNAISRCATDQQYNLGPALQQLRNYLSSTKNKRLHFFFGAQATGPNLVVNAFSDSDYSSGPDRRSTSAYVIALKQVPIAWSSQRQRCVAHSTAEAEYVALSNTIKMCKYFMHLADFCTMPHQCAVFSDNNAAVASMLSPTVSSKLRHIDTAIHSAREFFTQTDSTLQYVQSDQNIADLFTKALDLQGFNNHARAFLI